MSRELNAEVAEKVMGWKWVDQTNMAIGFWLFPPDEIGKFLPSFIYEFENIPKDAYFNYRESMPPYTTDPSADYEVLKHVRESWGMEQILKLDTALMNEYLSRREKDISAVRFRDFVWYEPGDFAKAALKVVNDK